MSNFEIHPYSLAKNNIKDFDLALFSGYDFVSNMIKNMERSELKQRSDEIPESRDAGYFSHCGMFLTGKMLTELGVPNVNFDGIYVWESTMSGVLGSGVYDINGETFLGVQVRNFDEVVSAYSSGYLGNDISNAKVCIAVAHLSDAIRKGIDKNYSVYVSLFRSIFQTYQGKRWDAQPISLLASIFKQCRCCGKKSEKILGTEDWIFCSEMVAHVYMDLGIFDSSCKPKYVLPMDFLGHETDDITGGGIPVVVKCPILLKADVLM